MYFTTFWDAFSFLSSIFLLGFVAGLALIGNIALGREARLENKNVLLRRQVVELERERDSNSQDYQQKAA
jgi:hypothetical protein